MKKGAFTRRWFKPIPDFPGYWINKKGRVWSMKAQKFLQWTFNQKYYWQVQLYNSGKRFQCLLHRIVAKVFVPNPDPKHKTEVDHIDHDIKNPFWKNLRWLTPLENQRHRRKKRYIAPPPGTYINDSVYVPF